MAPFLSAHLLRTSLVRHCYLLFKIGRLTLSRIQWTLTPGAVISFLASKNCNSSCSGHNEYDPSASFTSRDLGKNFTLEYDDGFENSTVNGNEYTDVVTIAGLAVRGNMSAFFCSEALTRLTLGEEPDNWRGNLLLSGFSKRRVPPDGLMGLAFQSVSVYGAQSPVQNLISEHVLTCPMFGIKLAHNGSEFFLGGVNTDLFQGKITWVPLSNAVWQISEYV